MKKYLEEIFGVSVKIELWNGKSKLPLYLRNKREYYVLSIENNQRILMKNDSYDFAVAGYEKEMEEIEKYAGMPAILWLDAVSTYQRNALVKNRISFIVPNSQFYVPELGICLKEFCAGKRERVEKISAATQYLLLYFIYQKEQKGKSQSELARELGLSAMNVSRAVQELQDLNFLEVRKEGTSKIVKATATGKELFQLASRYLQSPVQKKIYVSLKGFDKELLYAGETALAKMSMLNYPKHTVYAMDKKYTKNIVKESIVEPKLTTDKDYVEIELWKYNPETYSADAMVDIISLILSLNGVDDERVEMQIEKIMEEYEW